MNNLRNDGHPTERFAEEITSLLVDMVDRQMIDEDTLNSSGLKTLKLPGFSSYPSSTNKGSRVDPSFRRVGPPQKRFLYLWIII